MLVDVCCPEANRRPRASPRTRRSAIATQGRRPRRRQERGDAARVAVSDGAGLEATDLSGMQPRIHRPPRSILVMRDAPPTASRRSERTRTRCGARPRLRRRRRRRRVATSKIRRRSRVRASFGAHPFRTDTATRLAGAVVAHASATSPNAISAMTEGSGTRLGSSSTMNLNTRSPDAASFHAPAAGPNG